MQKTKPQRLKICAASYLILIHNKTQVLLLLRNNTGYADGLYSLIAGHVEENETIQASIIREAQEEAGITINPQDLEFGCVMHRRAQDRDGLDFFFVTKKWTGQITNAEPTKCAGLAFFSLNQLPSQTLDYVEAGIRASLNGTKYLERGWL
jgi:8-oxo-dGTP pyrophosphatase MutT (NUDIX family)